MKDLAVVTTLIGKRHENIAKHCHPTQERYAQSCGADFIVYDGRQYHVNPGLEASHKISSNRPSIRSETFAKEIRSMRQNTTIAPAFGSYNKLNLVELLKYYKRVLYIDTDIIIRNDSPNIFKIVPEDRVGMVNESNFILQDREENMRHWAELFNLEYVKWNKKYYNCGLFLISRGQEGLLSPPEKLYDDDFYEQTLINWNIVSKKIKMYDLSYKFNRVFYMDDCISESKYNSYFIHYAGSWTVLSEGHSQEATELVGFIKNDLIRWEEGSPKHQYDQAENSFWS